ncbi:uncharacterized protein (TIGR01732 family) [Salirhabdus euzebyi]|uniref:Uncharacterized protein (TIGR01732 family) n=1 Tax=Salirhabdus euzebyi TaxID=394506 RepID=A0A841Q8N7_9BACI|nr:uncharacterized protein (TIGR01732 family) [Salirhabdus euzebyi]
MHMHGYAPVMGGYDYGNDYCCYGYGYGYGGTGYGSGFALIVVLFILLIIVGAAFYS